MPLSSQEDISQKYTKTEMEPILTCTPSPPPPPTHHQPGDWIILSAPPKSFKGYQQTVTLTLHKAIWGRVSAANE